MPDAFHREILSELKKHAGHGTSHSGNGSYSGNEHFSYHLSAPLRKEITRAFLRKHKDMPFGEFPDLLDALFAAPSHDEKLIASIFIKHSRAYRQLLAPERLDGWLDHLMGWAEVDALCQSNFTADEMLADWAAWRKILQVFSRSEHIHERRASLVLLTGPVAHSADSRLAQLAFRNVHRLKEEKNALITKAISWLLRSLVQHHKRELAAYLKENRESLLKVAIRETERKLLTGRK